MIGGIPTIALVGLGDNSKNLHKPLLGKSVNLIAVCDKNAKAWGRPFYEGIPFYQDYRELVELDEVQYIYIATEPKSHAEIARFFLNRGINVLCEKPPATSFEEYSALEDLARMQGTFYNIVYHFRFSDELLWLKKRLPGFGDPKSIDVLFHDPYLVNGEIKPGREVLGGCWQDSGSNILSALSFLFPNLQPRELGKSIESDGVFGQPIKTTRVFEWQDALFCIQIIWCDYSREKRISLCFEKDSVVLDFSNQEVFHNGVLVQKRHHERSSLAHYSNYFDNFSEYCLIGQNKDVTRYLYSDS